MSVLGMHARRVIMSEPMEGQLILLHVESKFTTYRLNGGVRKTDEAAGLQQQVADKLLLIWQRNQRSPRLAIPLLRTLDLLLAQSALDKLVPSPDAFLGKGTPRIVRRQSWFAD